MSDGSWFDGVTRLVRLLLELELPDFLVVAFFLQLSKGFCLFQGCCWFCTSCLCRERRSLEHQGGGGEHLQVAHVFREHDVMIAC